MVKNKLITLTLRKVKKTIRRFISLTTLSFLGVVAFVGIKMSNPDMIESLDTYYKQNNVYDLKVISTLGLTDEDITSISNLDDRLKVYGSHSKDMQFYVENQNSVIKVMEITNDVNKIIIQEGRMPLNNNEIIIEKGIMNKLGINLGDKIYLDVSEDDTTINAKELTLVGVVTSPIYVINSNANINRGNTNLGIGGVNYYGYTTSDFFNMDYYTELYITCENEYKTNSDEYNKLMDEVFDKVSGIKEAREKDRKDKVIQTAKDEIEKKEAEGLNKFTEAKNQLDTANNKLEKGRKELEINKNKLNEAKKQLDDAKKQLDEGNMQIRNGETQLNETKKELDNYKNEIEKTVAKYNLSYDDICLIIEVIEGRNLTKDEVISLLPKDIKNYNSMVDVINYIYNNKYEKALKNFINGINKNELIDIIPKNIKNYDEVVEYIKGIDISKTRKKIILGCLNEKYIEEIKSRIPKYVINYKKIINALDNYEEFAKKIMDLYNGVNKLQDAYTLYNEKVELLEKAKTKIKIEEKEYNSALSKYNNGLQEYNNGKKIYNTNLNLYNSQIEEYNLNFEKFNKEIEKGKYRVDSLEDAKWFIYNRIDNSDYESYIESSESVERLAIIFPTIFFIVAIFISSLSMARMAIEDRSEIGTLKSLGYSNMSIRNMYTCYAAIATLLGGILGSILGFFTLPKIIFDTYKMMYEIPIFTYSINVMPILLGMIISLICICGATILTINGLVEEKTTDLLRPLNPNKGKKILLENIDFIWKKLKFLNKVTIRNIFRYKKRVGLTIIGIVGCTTLLLSGYAIRDSIVSVGNKHFNEIFVFDEMLYLDGRLNADELDQKINNAHIKEKEYINMSTVEVGTDVVNLFVANDVENLDKIVKLKDIKTNEKIKIEKDKVVVSSKLAKRNNLKVNDKVEFIDSQNNKYSFTISDITENYVGNYIYMDSQTYEKNINQYDINICYIKLDDVANDEEVAKELLQNNPNILSSVSTKSVLDRFDNIFGRLDSVVVILVILSGALSFVVLYNLVYVSISEREREIATLKVLGFNHKEIDLYIIKEETIITIIGIFIGLLVGTWFSKIIVETLEVATVQFVKTILFRSYLRTFIFMMLFKLIVNIRVHFTLKKIDMIESLKSIE